MYLNYMDCDFDKEILKANFAKNFKLSSQNILLRKTASKIGFYYRLTWDNLG